MTNTEADILTALHRRYTVVSQGAGERYIRADHVRCRAGFDAKRTADFIAVDTWDSGGLAIHGHEIKTSRADWLRELKEPEKAGAFTGSDVWDPEAPPRCDYWWLVVANRAIVQQDELPHSWGLLTLGASGRVRRVTPAHRLTPPEPWRGSRGVMSKSFAVALMRSVAKTYAHPACRTEVDQQEEQARQDVTG